MHTQPKYLAHVYKRRPGHNHPGLCFGCLRVEVPDVGVLCAGCGRAQREALAEDAAETKQDERRDGVSP